MRIISWNTFVGNKRIQIGMRHILSLKPDVICLQEIPHRIMPWLSTIKGYTLSSCFDYEHHHLSTRHWYICTLTKQKPIRVTQHTYDNGFSNSLLTKIYTSLLHLEEKHLVLVVTMTIRGKTIQIANTRLSCAIGTHDRLQEFTTLIKKTKCPTVETIYCGDFNVVDSKLFNRLTGWIRGFKHFDYLLDERGSFEKLYIKEHLINIFRGKSTSLVNRPLLQLDHILVPDTYRVQSYELTKKRYGSDHKILIVDVATSPPIRHT
jgi:endonuclease/exonuclease/phosphatase family metal-dependent hydrolase